MIAIANPAQALRLRWRIQGDPSHNADPSDRNMRRSSLFSRPTHNLVVALAIVTAAAAPVRAHLPVASQGDPPSEPTATFDEALPGLKAEDDVDESSHIEAEPDVSTEPSFGGPIGERTKLTGDWFGRRTKLNDGGITLDVSTAQFYASVTSGGLQQQFQYGGRNDYFLNLDAEKLGLWSGASVTLHGETRYGESVNSISGTIAAPNLMLAFPLATGSVTALTGVTFTQSLSDELQVYFGKLNTLDGFEQPLTGAGNLSGFQNTAMLYNPVFARTVPYSTLGAGFDLTREKTSFSVVAYDTNDTTTVTGFNTFFSNGVTIYSELNFTTNFFDRPGHQGFSGTYSSGTYSDLTPTAYLDPISGLNIVTTPRTGSWCLAYNFDQALYVDPDDSERMWGVFGNFGMADSNPSPVSWFASAGISGAAGLPRRKADTFGFSYFYVGVSDSLKDLSPRLLPLRDEYGIELYYNAALNPWCQITPDLQVISPFRDQASTAILFGLRARIDF